MRRDHEEFKGAGRGGPPLEPSVRRTVSSSWRPGFDLAPGVREIPKPPLVEALIAEAAANALDVGVVDRRVRALLIELRVWTTTFISALKILASSLVYAIWDALAAKNIEIPFPQRDLHVRSGSLLVETRPAGPAA